MSTSNYPPRVPYTGEIDVFVAGYKIILKSAKPYHEHFFNLVSTIELRAKDSPRVYALTFRRQNEIKEPEYDKLNDIVFIDFSIEETAAVILLLESGKKIRLELKKQEGRVWVELSSPNISSALQSSVTEAGENADAEEIECHSEKP
jgi:hypothetical protein